MNTDGVLSFNDTAFQVVSGGVQGISFTNLEDENNADPTADATNAVVEIPAGTYDISLEFYGNQPPNTTKYLGFFKIQSGVDDIEEFASNNRQQQFFGTATSDIDAIYRVEEHDLVLDQAEKFYLRLGNHSGVGDNRMAGYIRIETVV